MKNFLKPELVITACIQILTKKHLDYKQSTERNKGYFRRISSWISKRDLRDPTSELLFSLALETKTSIFHKPCGVKNQKKSRAEKKNIIIERCVNVARVEPK